MNRMTLVFVAHDAGSARAILPVAQELLQDGFAIEPFLAGPAYDIWSHEWPEIPARKVTDHLNEDDALDLLAGSRAAAVVSGSGLYNRLEHTVRMASQRRSIPVIAVLDSWLNYPDRFQRSTPEGLLRSWPDWVCAMDDISRLGIITMGFPIQRVLMTGPVNLEYSKKQVAAISPEKIRRDEGFNSQVPVLTFFSDPFFLKPDGQPSLGVGGLMKDPLHSRYGYTSTSMLRLCLDELSRAFESAHQRCHVIVKPHPMEEESPLRQVLQERSRNSLTTSIRTDRKPAEWIAASNAVFGMMSIVLLEAAVSGRPSVSIEIGLQDSQEADPCVSNILGYTRLIQDLPALRWAAGEFASGNWDSLRSIPKKPLNVDGAAHRVAQCVKNTIVQEALR